MCARAAWQRLCPSASRGNPIRRATAPGHEGGLMQARHARFLRGGALLTFSACFSGPIAAQPPVALDFYPVAPCRLIDTRDPVGPMGGPALVAGTIRTVQLPGTCGLPTPAAAGS